MAQSGTENLLVLFLSDRSVQEADVFVVALVTWTEDVDKFELRRKQLRRKKYEQSSAPTADSSDRSTTKHVNNACVRMPASNRKSRRLLEHAKSARSNERGVALA